jgi:ethanolamine utilization microcompartment shell protein EutL
MTYTFISAQYANSDNTAAVAITQEAAAVLLSQTDTPAAWQALHDADIEIAAYVAPAIETPPTKAELLQKVQALMQQIDAINE